MKIVGYILLAAGFLAGAYATSLDVSSVNWALFVSAAVAGVAGLALFKRQASLLQRSDSVLEMNRSELRDSIHNIVKDLDELTNGTLIRGAALRERIDLKLREDLRRFAAARQSMVHLFGLQIYADIMSSFAAGERYINRVWSASADGYDNEAETYLRKAAAQFGAARQQLNSAVEIGA